MLPLGRGWVTAPSEGVRISLVSFISEGEMEREVDRWISADGVPDCRGEERAQPEALDGTDTGRCAL